MLTLQQLKNMPPSTVFATGITTDDPEGVNIGNTGRELRWAAVRGGIYDWAIYAHEAYHSREYVRDHGIKISNEHNIKKLVPCDEEAFEMYRY